MSLNSLPVKPNSPATVKRCARSKNRLPPPTTLSTCETCAFLAAWCAALNRLTRSSGDSPPLSGEAPPLLLGPLPPLPPGTDLFGDVPAAAAEAADLALEAADAAGEADDGLCLDEAWGVVEVKRVASDALRAVKRAAIGA